MRNAQAAERGNEMSLMFRLLTYLKPYKKDLWLGGLAAVFLTALTLVPPRVSGLLIDGIETNLPARTLWIYLGVLGGSYVLQTFFLWVRLSRMAYMGERVAHDIRTQVYGHLQTLSLRFFTRKQTGSIISRCSSDTDRLWDFIAFGVIEVALSVLMLAGLGTVLLFLDWRLGLIMTDLRGRAPRRGPGAADPLFLCGSWKADAAYFPQSLPKMVRSHLRPLRHHSRNPGGQGVSPGKTRNPTLCQ
jgi:ABC-type multidrug transport system fused ATPase/permease subunit